MKSRKLIIAFAVILPLLGVLAMVSWANNARKAAYDGATLYTVVRAKTEIPSGTKTADLATYVTTVKVPKDVLPMDEDGDPLYLASLGDADDGTTDGVIPAGEILLNDRILTAKEREDAYALPTGDTEITIKLDGSRGSSKSVKIGDKVTIYASFDSGPEAKASTGAIIHSAVITQINGTSKADSADAKAPADSEDPDLLITVGVTTEDAQKLIYAMEFGSIWFGLENPDTDLSPLGLTFIEDLGRVDPVNPSN